MEGHYVWKLLGGAMEPFCHAQSKNTNRTLDFTTCNVCERFHLFSSMFSHRKTKPYFMASKASPWQQRLMNRQNLWDIASSTSHNSEYPCSGGSDQPTRNSGQKCRAYYFLLPVGGAITMTQYGRGNLLRAGLWSSMRYLGQIGQITFELQQLMLSWRRIEIRRLATPTRFSENSPSSVAFITKACRWHTVNFK